MISIKYCVYHCLLGLITAAFVANLINSSKSFPVAQLDKHKISVLVTGCSSGLGFDLVRALLEERNNVEVFAGVRKKDDFAIFNNLKNRNRLHPLLLDVANRNQVLNALGEVKKAGLPLYALINNAGISNTFKGPLTDDVDAHVASVAKVFDTNILGLMSLTGHAMPLLKDAAAQIGSARVLNVGSLMGLVFTPNCTGYCASKHALEAITADWRFQWEPSNITASVLEPGFFKTNMCTEKFCSDDASVCTKVALDAIFSSRPRPRYQCASVFGIPGYVVSYMVNVFPDRFVEVVLRTFEHLEKLGYI